MGSSLDDATYFWHSRCDPVGECRFSIYRAAICRGATRLLFEESPKAALAVNARVKQIEPDRQDIMWRLSISEESAKLSPLRGYDYV